MWSEKNIIWHLSFLLFLLRFNSSWWRGVFRILHHRKHLNCQVYNKIFGINNNCTLWDDVLFTHSANQLNSTHPSDNTHFSPIQLQFKHYFHRPGLTAMHQTTPHTSSIYLAFSVLTRILFQLQFTKLFPSRSDSWLWLLNHILHLHSTYLLNNRIYVPFPAIPHYQYPDANQY